MTPRDWALVVSALLDIGLILTVVWLLDRLNAERLKCRRECPLVETVQQQLRSLCYAWGELDRHAREKRETGT